MAWADTNYIHKKKITIDHTKVAGNEVDFPIGINITDADLTGCLANGFDIKFYDSTETVQLKHERERWVKATGNLVAWIKIPSISSIVDTEIYMYYQYPLEVVDQANATNVWDTDYVSVLHCKDANTQLTDSTANGNDFPEVNNPNYQISGQIGYGSDVDNVWRQNNGDCWERLIPDLNTWTASTFEYWENCDEGWQVSPAMIISVRFNGGNDIRLTFLPQIPNTGFGWWYDDGVADGGSDYTHAWSPGEWHQAAVTQDNGTNTLKGFTEGANVMNVGCNYAYGVSETLFTIGSRHLIAYASAYNGNVDEIRISKIARGDNWIQTSYMNQDSPGTFSTFGPQENYSSAPVNFLLPVKGHIEKRYRYKDNKSEYKRYSGIQKDRLKYKAKKQE